MCIRDSYKYEYNYVQNFKSNCEYTTDFAMFSCLLLLLLLKKNESVNSLDIFLIAKKRRRDLRPYKIDVFFISIFWEGICHERSIPSNSSLFLIRKIANNNEVYMYQFFYITLKLYLIYL